MPMLRFLLVVGLVSITPAAWAQDDAQVARGKTLLEANCARCHAIGLTDKSTHPSAPAFRTLSRLYPVESLEEALAEGISTRPSGYAGIRGVAGTNRRDRSLHWKRRRSVANPLPTHRC